MNYQAVIFDFNGTLFFDGPKHRNAWSKLIQELRGTPLTDDELQKVAGPTNLEIIHDFFPNLPEAEAISLSKQKEALYRKSCLEDPDFTHLVNGAEVLFDTLTKHHIPFTIASASIQENIDFFVEIFHLDRWIDKNMIVYDDGYHKNKTEMYWHAARNLKVPPERCVIFEDSLSGITHAKAVNAGYLCVLCKPEESQQKLALGADKTISDFTEFDISILLGESS